MVSGLLVRAVAGAIAFAALLAPASALGSTFPGQNGHIAFLSPLDYQCLQLVEADGTGRHAPGACEVHPSLRLPSARLSPDGTRVAAPIYDLANDVYDVRVTDLDGSDPVFVPGQHYVDPFVRWSPDGQLLAIVEQFSPWSCCDGGFLHVEHADGTGGTAASAYVSYSAAWSNDGRVAYTWNDYDANYGSLSAANGDGSGGTGIFSGPAGVGNPEWSPSSDRLAFNRGGLAVINDDGTGLQQLGTVGPGQPEWSPDGQAIAFETSEGGNREIRSVAPDGTQSMNLTNHPASDSNPIWSPDATKIAFESDRDGDVDIYVMNPDGSGVVQVTNDAGTDRLQDWQSIPINSYPRPKGATPTQVSLVPAYTQCTAPNRTHGPPLAFDSCNPPAQASDELTVGTADSNARPTKSRGLVRYDAIPGAPGGSADEADVQLTVELVDVYEQGTLADYAGELRALTSLRITDKLNTPHPGGPGAGTVSDIELEAIVPCAPTADTTEGASCNLTTTFDSLVPGTVTEGRRSVWELGRAELLDAAGAPFMRQGLFVP